MNAQHQALVQRLDNLLTVAGVNAVPELTRLSNQFESDEAVMASVPPTFISELDQVGFALQSTGTMASNNLQGAESRRAHAEGQAPVDYPAFTWVYQPVGTVIDRLNSLFSGLKELDKAVNQPPPPPPVNPTMAMPRPFS